MIHYTKGNLLDSSAEALVNTVNTVGVMGKGIALQFKERFPMNYARYHKACKDGKVRIGEMFVTTEHSLIGNKLSNENHVAPTVRIFIYTARIEKSAQYYS